MSSCKSTCANNQQLYFVGPVENRSSTLNTFCLKSQSKTCAYYQTCPAGTELVDRFPDCAGPDVTLRRRSLVVPYFWFDDGVVIGFATRGRWGAALHGLALVLLLLMLSVLAFVLQKIKKINLWIFCCCFSSQALLEGGYNSKIFLRPKFDHPRINPATLGVPSLIRWHTTLALGCLSREVWGTPRFLWRQMRKE